MAEGAKLSRQELLGKATLLAGTAVLAGLPDALRLRGWLEAANAAGPSLVEDTIDGLVAFVVPGRDRYSAHQGTRTRSPGGIEAGATPEVIRALDRFLVSGPPLSSTAATLLNGVAVQVAPGSAHGKFVSPFANLSFAEKTKVFAQLESLPGDESGSIRFLIGNLPDLVAFVTYSEAGAFDRARRRIRRRPLGWRLTRYTGVADGRAEFRGYYGGRQSADDA